MLKCVLVFSACVAIAWGSMAMGLLEQKPAKYAHKQGCYIRAIERVIPFGATFKNKDCTTYICGTEYYQVFTCGSVSSPPNCKPVYDLKVPYPDCCTPKSYDCDHKNTTTTA